MISNQLYIYVLLGLSILPEFPCVKYGFGQSLESRVLTPKGGEMVNFLNEQAKIHEVQVLSHDTVHKNVYTYFYGLNYVPPTPTK